MSVWRFCLKWGISWDTYWSLDADEEAALHDAARELMDEERRERRRQAGR